MSMQETPSKDPDAPIVSMMTSLLSDEAMPVEQRVDAGVAILLHCQKWSRSGSVIDELRQDARRLLREIVLQGADLDEDPDRLHRIRAAKVVLS